MQAHYLQQYGYADCHDRVPRTAGWRKMRGWMNYFVQVEPALQGRLAEMLAGIDFDLPIRLNGDSDWDEMLSELGIPEWD